jgi:hypothetical protein
MTATARGEERRAQTHDVAWSQSGAQHAECPNAIVFGAPIDAASRQRTTQNDDRDVIYC